MSKLLLNKLYFVSLLYDNQTVTKMSAKQRYSIKFEARKSLGNYDRRSMVSKSNLTWSGVRSLVNRWNPLGLSSNGWYIRGSVMVKDELSGTIRDFVKPSLIQAGREFSEL